MTREEAGVSSLLTLPTPCSPGRFHTEEEALAIANAADVGLAGGCASCLRALGL